MAKLKSNVAVIYFLLGCFSFHYILARTLPLSLCLSLFLSLFGSYHTKKRETHKFSMHFKVELTIWWIDTDNFGALYWWTIPQMCGGRVANVCWLCIIKWPHIRAPRLLPPAASTQLFKCKNKFAMHVFISFILYLCLWSTLFPQPAQINGTNVTLMCINWVQLAHTHTLMHIDILIHSNL